MVAPETAAHAAGTAALLPMITLGVPGSPTAAVLLGGLMIWGLQPGPLLFVEQKDFVWGLIASMYLGNIAGLIVVLTCVPLFAAIHRSGFCAAAQAHDLVHRRDALGAGLDALEAVGAVVDAVRVLGEVLEALELLRRRAGRRRSGRPWPARPGR